MPEVVEPVDVAVLLVCAAALATDLSRQRVPNALSFPTMLMGVLYWGYAGDVLFALEGIVLAFACLFPGFLFGAIRAGDAKLMMAVGAFYGGSMMVRASVFTYALAIPFGLIVLLKQGKLNHVLAVARSVMTSAPPVPEEDRVVVAFVPVVVGGILLARTTGFLG